MENTDKQEILSAIAGLAEGQQSLAEGLHGLADHMDERFDAVDKRFEAVDRRFERLEGKFGVLEGRVGSLGSQMVTKDYLDRKLADLKGETVVMIRRALSPST